jgi:hypothetical protein
VPRRVLADAKERLLLVDNLRPLHLRQGIHRRRLLRRRRRLLQQRITRISNDRFGRRRCLDLRKTKRVRFGY